MLRIRTSTCTKFFVCIIAFLFITPTIASGQGGWVINSFDSNIVINDDATITVTETIDVDFSVQKHGIYRDLPVRYQDDYGNSFKTDLDVISVLQDGESASVSYEYGYNFTSLKIGDADELITGEHQYVITYTVDKVFLYFEDYDELYWNVTGTEWEVPIKHSSAIVVLPSGTTIAQSACYTGKQGSIAQDCAITNTEHSISFTADDFLTVAVGFSKGFIYEPTQSDRFWMFVVNNLVIVLPWIFVVGVFIFWLKHGKDPKIKKAIVAQYEPPKGIKAVYAGMIVDGSIKPEHMSAMIIQLAVDGYLKIDVVEKDKIMGVIKQMPEITLTPIKGVEGLDTSHAYYYELLFRGKMDPVKLSEIKSFITPQKVSKLRRLLHTRLIEDGFQIKKSSAYGVAVFIPGIIIGFIGIMLIPQLFGTVAAFSFIASGVIVCIFGATMPKPTPLGIETKWYLLGFKDFMHTAERYRSEWQEKENIFAQYLPYAIAFNDVKKWAKTFEGVYQKQPDWYSGNVALVVLASSGRFDAVSSAVKSATLPGSSGSGGGGHSGGGFGGGGGGSW